MFEVDHSAGAAAATGLNLSSTLPAGMEVATPLNTNTTCGGVVTAVAGGTTVDFAGGTVGAGMTCEVTADVTVDAAGDYEVTADFGSDLGGTPPGTVTGNLAGGTVIDVPTMSSYGLLALMGILGLLAITVIRRRG